MPMGVAAAAIRKREIRSRAGLASTADALTPSGHTGEAVKNSLGGGRATRSVTRKAAEEEVTPSGEAAFEYGRLHYMLCTEIYYSVQGLQKGNTSVQAASRGHASGTSMSKTQATQKTGSGNRSRKRGLSATAGTNQNVFTPWGPCYDLWYGISLRVIQW
ncbi:hypothetical protein BC628DRAFT_272228 [Trametes gibbosa]|nr:hypothetical protein BC628DRAFT_272228 [Trametes gibbosa]